MNSIKLFEHNIEAYNSALSLLEKNGKAAIIHPTGTGKSLIAFKLSEENPDKKICWLSPSEYIFMTQCENLTEMNFDVPQNIMFFTYAKLMFISEEEVSCLEADYIILDEFHRCGAEMWGKGVKRLLNTHKNVPVLGLSATNIRYLDNQRDMADELFDGNVASYMTLGEAIVRGILNPPKYVLSMFLYDETFKKYEMRISKTKNKFMRDKAEMYLDELRHSLEKADGLDVIFDKHMTERTGKYILFCANKKHMDEMITHAGEWFAKIDKCPHIYSVYTSEPNASKEFNDFKADNDEQHLRLLYCIDALNEGIHLENISGVILLRPTVSPIIYKQQIGRALSASKKKNSVIFDIVLNIENLYSIGAVEDEVEITTAYYRSHGDKDSIVNDRFKVIDEIRDCRALFDKLNDVLNVSWDLYYKHAEKYYKEHGNLEIPARYITEDGYALGRWIFNQKSIRKGNIDGNLTELQIEKLDRIGMIWESYSDINWERNYLAAEKYFEETGNLNIPAKYITKEGIPLGSWISALRTWRKSGIHSKYLTDERISKLNKIGMIWDALDYFWETNYAAAEKYFHENGNLNVPATYITKDGIRLGAWISRLRALRRNETKGTPPSDEQIARLDEIGMIWAGQVDAKWEKGYSAAKEYAKRNGDLLVPTSYVTEDGFKLGTWIQRQRRVYQKGTILESRKNKLIDIGMVWEADTWESRFILAKDYFIENGNLYIPQNYVINGVWLGKWIAFQKKAMKEGKLNTKQTKMLSELPLEQVGEQNTKWQRMYLEAKKYYTLYGNLNVSSDYRTDDGHILSDWIIRQRAAYNQKKLTEEQIEKLEAIDFSWQVENVWEKGYRHAMKYYKENGNLDMNQKYKCDDGFALGIWVFNYRKSYNGLKSTVKITEEQAELLEKIGMVWNPDTIWDKRFAEIKNFYIQNNRLPKYNSDNEKERKMAYWLNNQRKFYRDGRLERTKLEKLALIGASEEWLSAFKQLNVKEPGSKG